jgi:DNA-binding MarR family transcriptional regulator
MGSGHLLLRVANVIHQSSTAVYARKHGLSVPEWRILGRLSISGPMLMPTLCRVSYFDKAQATRVVRALIKRGLATNSPDESHHNRLWVDATATGRELASRVFPDAEAEQHRLLGTLTREERQATFKALNKFLAAYGVTIPPRAARYKDLED